MESLSWSTKEVSRFHLRTSDLTGHIRRLSGGFWDNICHARCCREGLPRREVSSTQALLKFDHNQINRIELSTSGGHSSIPPSHTVCSHNLRRLVFDRNLQSIGILSHLIHEIERTPFKAVLVRSIHPTGVGTMGPLCDRLLRPESPFFTAVFYAKQHIPKKFPTLSRS